MSKHVFTVTIPEDQHSKLAESLAKVDHVHIATSKTSGASGNTDGTVLHFQVLHGDVVEVAVIANPNHVSLATIQSKLQEKIAEHTK